MRFLPNRKQSSQTAEKITWTIVQRWRFEILQCEDKKALKKPRRWRDHTTYGACQSRCVVFKENLYACHIHCKEDALQARLKIKKFSTNALTSSQQQTRERVVEALSPMQIPTLKHFQISKMDKIVHLSELGGIQWNQSKTYSQNIIEQIVHLVAGGRAWIRLNIEVNIN